MNTRIAGYDFARSFALFGLVVANFSVNFEKTNFNLNQLVQTRLHFLMQGGAGAAFLVLGGIGISLLIQRVRITNKAYGIADSRKRLIKRAASLLVVGICCNLIWQTRFLGFYSVYIVIGALLLAVSNRWLWSLAFVFIIIFVGWIPLIHGYFDYFEIIRNWEILRDSDPWTVNGIVSRLVFSEFHRIFSWTAFLLIGMWLGRQNVHQPRVRRNIFLGGIVIALAAECAVWTLIYGSLWSPYSFTRLVTSAWSLESMVILKESLDFFATGGSAILIIGASLMLTERYPDLRWTKPFLATGQIALTLYVIHLIIGKGLQALGVLDKTLPLTIGSAVIFCICAIIFSHFWTKRFERGPLEWGMRRITG